MLLGFAGKDLRERLSKEPRSLVIWALFFFLKILNTDTHFI